MTQKLGELRNTLLTLSGGKAMPFLSSIHIHNGTQFLGDFDVDPCYSSYTADFVVWTVTVIPTIPGNLIDTGQRRLQ